MFFVTTNIHVHKTNLKLSKTSGFLFNAPLPIFNSRGRVTPIYLQASCSKVADGCTVYDITWILHRAKIEHLLRLSASDMKPF